MMTKTETKVKLNLTDEEILQEIQTNGRATVQLLCTVLEKIEHTSVIAYADYENTISSQK